MALKHAGVDQGRLEQVLGKDRSTISRCLSGETNLPVQRFALFAQIADWDVVAALEESLADRGRRSQGLQEFLGWPLARGHVLNDEIRALEALDRLGGDYHKATAQKWQFTWATVREGAGRPLELSRSSALPSVSYAKGESASKDRPA